MTTVGSGISRPTVCKALCVITFNPLDPADERAEAHGAG